MKEIIQNLMIEIKNEIGELTSTLEFSLNNDERYFDKLKAICDLIEFHRIRLAILEDIAIRINKSESRAKEAKNSSKMQ